MQRVIVLGRGAVGKSTFAAQLAQILDIPVIELDRHFWSQNLTPLSTAAWIALQEQLATDNRWIMDGDLGPYDWPAPRLRRADTVVVLDLSLARCAWRAARRSRERADFWWWLLTWKTRSRPGVLHAVAVHAPQATLHVLRTPREVRSFLATAHSNTV